MSNQSTELTDLDRFIRDESSRVIHLEEADSLALRELTRRLNDAQTDAQIAAERAKLAITEIVVARQRLVRTLADRYGFDETISHEHDAAAHTLTRIAADSKSTG